MRMNVFYVFGAMAISMPLFLVSCSSADDAVETPHPTSSEAVKTSFTLSVGLPKSNTSGAKAMSRYFTGTTEDIAQQRRDQLLATTAADIRALAPRIRAVMEDDNVCVMGSEAKIREAKDLFANLVSLPD